MKLGVSLFGFARFLMDENVHVVFPQYQPNTPLMHRAGEVLISGTYRHGQVRRVITSKEFINLGLLFRDDNVGSVNRNPIIKSRVFHIAVNGKIVNQAMNMFLSAAQVKRLVEWGLPLVELEKGYYRIDLTSFDRLTESYLPGLMCTTNSQYLKNKRNLLRLESAVRQISEQLEVLARQIAWDSTRTAEIDAIGEVGYEDFDYPRYDYGPGASRKFEVVTYVLEDSSTGGKISFRKYPGGPSAYQSYCKLLKLYRKLQYIDRYNFQAITREFEIATWEHRGRNQGRNWQEVKIKRTQWEVRVNSKGLNLRRRFHKLAYPVRMPSLSQAG